ncbi:MAG: hypothetical protein Q9192_007312 [Flavoplaca navasiana]
MGFIEDEEDRRHHLDDATLSTSARSFPLLRLPRELRNLVYSHALVRPGSDAYVEPIRVCYMHHKASSRHGSTSYWGTEKSTRLFRVNHQIYNEASEIFYSTFSFNFPPTMVITMVNNTLGVLTDRCRRLIRNIGFTLPFRSVTSRITSKAENRMAQTFVAAARLLPNVTQVEVSIALIGPYIPEHQTTEAVERILETMTPFKAIPVLIIRDGDDENNQHLRILKGIREALTSQWRASASK